MMESSLDKLDTWEIGKDKLERIPRVESGFGVGFEAIGMATSGGIFSLTESVFTSIVWRIR